MSTTVRNSAAHRTGRVAALVLAAGSLVAGLGATLATAEEPVEAVPAAEKVCGGDPFGKACFYPYGDRITVWDTDSDGWRIQAKWRTSYGRTGVCAIQSGQEIRRCNYDMAEGRKITIDVEAYNEKFGLYKLLDTVRATI